MKFIEIKWSELEVGDFCRIIDKRVPNVIMYGYLRKSKIFMSKNACELKNGIFYPIKCKDDRYWKWDYEKLKGKIIQKLYD